jgi:hypothetical protein
MRWWSGQGEENGFAILNEEKVYAIRQHYLTGDYSFADLALAFKVSRATIGGVLTGRYWRRSLSECEEEALAEMRAERRKVR